ncbi:MAG: hypothetical protein M3376_07270 [Actinomycetota bacterium]|nr:hypothetical protein [Actinomycetota bacterium]
MTIKERLHELVDELSEREAGEALELIATRRGNAMAGWLDGLPEEEDEPISEREEAAVQEAREEVSAGAPLISSEAIKREFEHRPE